MPPAPSANSLILPSPCPRGSSSTSVRCHRPSEGTSLQTIPISAHADCKTSHTVLLLVILIAPPSTNVRRRAVGVFVLFATTVTLGQPRFNCRPRHYDATP